MDKNINIMLKSVLNVQINIIIKILILKNKYIVRKKNIHVRARRRTINHIGLTDMDKLVNLSSKQFGQRTAPAITPSPDSVRNTFCPKKKIHH